MSWLTVIVAIVLLLCIIFPDVIWDYLIRPGTRGGGVNARYTSMHYLSKRTQSQVRLVTRLFYSALLIQFVREIYSGYQKGQRLHRPYIIDRVNKSPIIGLEILLPAVVFIVIWNYINRRYYPTDRSWAFMKTVAFFGPIILIYWIILAH